MREKNLYTAVGRFERCFDTNGVAYPAVFLGGKEYKTDMQEIVLWSCLNWRLVREEEISHYYNDWMADCSFPTTRSLENCINRLITRGLLVKGSGETEYDTLYDLLSAMYILPVENSFLLRLYATIKVGFKFRRPFAALKFMFLRQKCTNLEKSVLHLSKRTPLSTAEVIRCVEMGVQKLSNSEAIMDCIYADRDTTSDNITTLVKAADCTRDVVTAVANLYLRQQIVFDRV